MVRRADRLEWLVLTNETEALVIEASLIKSLDPEYNIRLREDHPYPSIALDSRKGAIMIRTWRGPGREGVETFGPFPGAAARRVVDAILMVAPVRSCENSKYEMHRRAGQACLLASIGKCGAPCVNSNEVNDEHVATARRILRGGTTEISATLKNRMQTAAEGLQYELAAKLRDQIASLHIIRDAQAIGGCEGRDFDVLGTHLDGIGGATCRLQVRNGIIVRMVHHVVDAGIVDREGLLGAALAQGEPGAPTTVVHGGTLPQDVVQLYKNTTGQRARRHRGALERRLLETADRNAEEVLRRARMQRASNLDARRQELARLQEVLGLSRAPLRIESVDISHLGGAATVSTVAVLHDGVPVRNKYRRYRLKDYGGDDYAAMREVATRRLTDSIDGKAPFMDLLVVDGGHSQLNAVCEVMAELGLVGKFDVLSLAKRFEEVYLPGEAIPRRLDRHDSALLLLQRARDEAHRASNSFQRRVATKRLRRDFLDDVSGLGPVRKQRLLDAVGGWRGINLLGRDDLDRLEFLPRAVREGVWDALEAYRNAEA